MGWSAWQWSTAFISEIPLKMSSLSLYLCLILSLSLATYVSFSLSLSLCLSIYLSIYLSLYLSLSFSFFSLFSRSKMLKCNIWMIKTYFSLQDVNPMNYNFEPGTGSQTINTISGISGTGSQTINTISGIFDEPWNLKIMKTDLIISYSKNICIDICACILGQKVLNK